MYLRLCRFVVSAVMTGLSLGECARGPFGFEQVLPSIDIRSECAATHRTIDAIAACISENAADYQYIVHHWHRYAPERQQYCIGYIAGCLSLGRSITYAEARDCLETHPSDATRLSFRPAKRPHHS